ncbi:MAG: hypothetical protein MUC76_04630 [Spirochaetes bacterium]|jgi:hypothetical protein|nr:hypothetical protein [Spirochaetota bacterium]
MRNALLYAGGSFNFLLALFHLSFWKTLNWAEELPRLSADNGAIMQVSNIVIIYILLYFSVMSFVITRRTVLGGVAKSIILCIAGFYSIRLLAGYPFFGFNVMELAVWIACLLIIAVYVSVLFIGKQS